MAPITILQLAEHRGIRKSQDGSFSMADINNVGLQMIGGCEGCGATIACYNAYPSKSGFWRCEDCIGEDGYDTVQDAHRDIFGSVAPPPTIDSSCTTTQNQP